MKNNLLIVLTMVLLSSVTNLTLANTKNRNLDDRCGTVAPNMNWENDFQRNLATYMLNRMTSRNMADDSVTIPVIVHICFYSVTNPAPGTTYNISKAQVDGQFPVLNANFAGNSAYIGSIPAAFLPLKANTKIKWCQATFDQAGNALAEPGIDRINTRVIGLPNPGSTTTWRRSYIEDTLKPATIWNPKYYCNLWVVPGMSGGVLAYATFPTTTTLDGLGGGTGYDYNDGVVCVRQAFGTGGVTVAPYNNGGTVCHELGHWLGLRHIWGDDGRDSLGNTLLYTDPRTCTGSDYNDDTPPQSIENYGTPTYPNRPNTCGNGANGDMFMNYMDYVNDNVYNMFTLGQKDRMWTAMNTGQFRIPLKTSTACNTTAPPPIADFSDSVKTQVLCTSKTIKFINKSLFWYDATGTTWSWSFPGGTPSTSNARFPEVTYTSGGLKSVTLTVTNSRGTNTLTKNVSVSISSTGAFPLVEDFEGAFFPPVGWETVNRNGNQLINWEAVNGYSAYGVGNRTMKFDNTTLDAGQKKDDIMTYKINLTGVSDAKLKFDLSHAPYYNASGTGIGLQQPNPKWIWDTLEVLITDNCQSTTQSIYRKGDSALATVMPGQGEEFFPAANQWRTDSVVIPAGFLNKPNVQIVFRNYGGYGHSIYIDNINVKSSVTAPVTASFTQSDTTVCAGGSLTFTNTSTSSSGSPDSVRWTINGGTPSTSTSTTTVSPVFNTVGTYTISLVAYKSGTASTPYTKTIRVKVKPTVTVNSPAICSGQTATLTAGGASTYSWTGGLTGNPATTPALTGTTTYTVTGTTTELCSNTAVATVTVTALPTVTVNSPAICAGNTATLTANGATTYTWTGGLSGNPATTPALNTTTTYTVTGTASGCSKTAVATVTVTPSLNVTVNSPAICAGSTATLTAGGATTYTWTGGLSGNPATTPALNTTTTYTVTGTSGSCTGTAIATVTVTPLPNVTVNSPGICAGNTATLTANGATTYTWTGGLSGNPATTPALNSTTTYTVTGTSSG